MAMMLLTILNRAVLSFEPQLQCGTRLPWTWSVQGRGSYCGHCGKVKGATSWGHCGRY